MADQVNGGSAPRPGTEEYPAGTEEYPAGTEEYPSGTEEYPSPPDAPLSAGSKGTERWEGDETDLPWWKRYGFDQYEPFWEDVRNGVIRIETDDPRAQPRSRAAQVLRGEVGQAWLPSENDRSVGRPPSAARSECQVNVKLRGADFQALRAISEDYGVAPSTMARMLLRRGIQAAVGGLRQPAVPPSQEPGPAAPP